MVATATESPAARVVVVDHSADSREVLHTLLECRGVPSVEASGAWEGLELIRQHRPAVVVLDLDAQSADDERLLREIDTVAGDSQSALVVLGNERRYPGRLPDGQVIAKPYHYGPLLRTIEQLLGR